MKFLGLIFLLSFAITNAQTNYKYLASDKTGEKWYYNFDKKKANGFFTWLKIEHIEQKKSSKKISTEYYIEVKCSNRMMSDEIVRINWEDSKPEIYKKNYPFQKIPERHFVMNLVKKYCK